MLRIGEDWLQEPSTVSVRTVKTLRILYVRIRKQGMKVTDLESEENKA